MSKAPLIKIQYKNNTYAVSKGYNQINLELSFNKVIFLSHQKVPRVANAYSYSKITLKSLLLLANMEKSSKLDKGLQNK